mgnify:CR=1 FL=1
MIVLLELTNMRILKISLLKDTYISLFRRILSSLKKFFIRYKRSSKVLFLKGGIYITIGIRRVKVVNKAEEGSSVVAQIINTSLLLI